MRLMPLTVEGCLLRSPSNLSNLKPIPLKYRARLLASNPLTCMFSHLKIAPNILKSRFLLQLSNLDASKLHILSLSSSCKL